MKKAFDNLEKGQINIWYGVRYSLLGFFHLLIIEPLSGYRKLLKEYPLDRRKEKQYKTFALSLLPLLIIWWFVVYWFNGLYKDIYFRWNRDVYISKLEKTYKDDIELFFREYEQRYLARDCDFMKVVASDERMYDKWWQETYWNYSCEWFRTVQERIIKPISIGELKQSWNKVRVPVDIIWIDKNEWSPLIIKPLRIELWKTLDMDIWHFNVYWTPQQRIIESELRTN